MMLDAGNDTTQTTLSNCIYHLARYQRAQRKLREILLSHLRSPGLCEDEAIVPSYEELKHISYLRAVLDENFRCRPPLARGLPRRVMAPMMKIVAGGVTWDIRQGTTVSVPLWVIHHDANLFGEPNESIPERWMDNHDPQKGLGVYYTSDAEIKNLRDFFVLLLDRGLVLGEILRTSRFLLWLRRSPWYSRGTWLGIWSYRQWKDSTAMSRSSS